MSIKTRLFGKPWQHRDPDIRAQAVAESDDPELRGELGRIAEHDESERVRLAALERINTEPFWLDARLRESDTAITEAADRFLVKAVMRAENDALRTERLEWFRRFDDSEFIRRVAEQAPDPAMRAEALGRIDSPGFLGDRIVKEPDESLALSLIERVDQRSTLERIEAKLRRSSKRRARAVQERIHALQAESGEYDPAAASAGQLIERAERLARGQFEGDRGEELQALETQWSQLDSPSEALERRFRGALHIARRALEAPSRPRESAPESGSEQAPACDAALLELVERLESIESIDQLPAEQAATLLGDFDRRWQTLGSPTPADEQLRERALPILKKLQQQRSKITTAGEAPEPASKEKQGPEIDQGDWPAELDRVAEDLERGDLAAAYSGLRELRSRLDRLKPRQRPSDVSGRLGRLEGRLREMRDWEHWSNNQHRDELIERIEALAESDQHPDAISASLKEAREEWQRLEKLEILPGDKRRHAAPSGQWRRFQAACKQAFEKAQPFFEKRHEVQSENLEQLEAFLELGRSRAEAESPDLEVLKQTQRAARQAIRRLDDLPPKSRGRSAAQLRDLMDAISKRLDEGFETVENRKRRLVREAEALTRETDLKSAIEQAKALQARWKEAGSGRRRIEQELWKAFRAPIDPLFEKLGEESDQRREQQAAEQAELRAHVEMAEKLTEVDESELDQAQARMRALRAEFESTGRRPAQLTERFDKADRALQRRLDEQRAARRHAAERQREKLARAVQTAWQARSEDRSPDALPSDKDDSGDEILQTLKSVHESLASDDAALDQWSQRVSDNGEQARAVVIEMEFLAGLDSPPEDREARMNFQVERLARRMAERGQAPGLAEELKALRKRWYASFPQPLDQHETMAKRFHKCQNVLESMTGTE